MAITTDETRGAAAGVVEKICEIACTVGREIDAIHRIGDHARRATGDAVAVADGIRHNRINA